MLEKRVTGVYLLDEITGQEYLANSKLIVNATGPWVEKVIEMDYEIKGKSLLHTKGVHIVIDGKKLPLRQPLYFDTPDGRMVFTIPRNGKTYVGTTDTVFEEDLKHPQVTHEDKAYLINCIQKMFPKTQIKMEDIESTWAGVRPLIHEKGKGPSEISRKDEIWDSETGLITIAGGKLTGYRKMAETVTDLLISKLEKDGKAYGKSLTKKLKLSGGEFSKPEDFQSFIETKANRLSMLGMSIKDGTNIAALYGTNTNLIMDMQKEILHESDLPLPIKLTLHYGIKHEMTMTPVDFFMRRTGTLFFDIKWVQTWKEPVTHYMEQVFNWTPERKMQVLEELELRIQEATS